MTIKQVGGTYVDLCVNADAGIEFWFCYHWQGRVSPGAEALNDRGECGACGRISALTIDDTPPSFMLPDSEL
jgi:hypothetical protein